MKMARTDATLLVEEALLAIVLHTTYPMSKLTKTLWLTLTISSATSMMEATIVSHTGSTANTQLLNRISQMPDAPFMSAKTRLIHQEAETERCMLQTKTGPTMFTWQQILALRIQLAQRLRRLQHRKLPSVKR
jgi:hypothetical protein